MFSPLPAFTLENHMKTKICATKRGFLILLTVALCNLV